MHLAPIEGYEEKPLVSLIEAIEPVAAFFPDIEEYIDVALKNCQNAADNLTQQESAAIYLYTMQIQGGLGLYRFLNQSLRTENREELISWFSFLKLFLTALHKLPSQSGIIWRGIKNVDLRSTYKKGIKFVRWGVSSCTSDLEVLESEDFLGRDGLRTIFSIECINGKSIVNHSHYKDGEQEIILMPGTYFEVIGQLSTTSELHIIQLKEIPPSITVNKSSVQINPLPVVKKPTLFSPLLRLFSSDTVASISSTVWKQNGITVVGGNGAGNQLNQLSTPVSILIDDDQTLYIADSYNHRILEWKSNGRIVASGTAYGNSTHRLCRPRCVIIDKEKNSFIISDQGNRRVMRRSRQDNTNGEIIIENIQCFGVAIDKSGDIYVSDHQKNEVRRWQKKDKEGTVVAGGSGEDNRPAFIFVDKDYSVYVVDQKNHRVMKRLKGAKEGMIVAGGQEEGNSLAQLSIRYIRIKSMLRI